MSKSKREQILEWLLTSLAIIVIIVPMTRKLVRHQKINQKKVSQSTYQVSLASKKATEDTYADKFITFESIVDEITDEISVPWNYTLVARHICFLDNNRDLVRVITNIYKDNPKTQPFSVFGIIQREYIDNKRLKPFWEMDYSPPNRFDTNNNRTNVSMVSYIITSCAYEYQSRLRLAGYWF